MNHINKYLCLHSFDSDYLCCQIYNKSLEWHAVVGVGVIVGVVCGIKCICVHREHHRLDEDLQSGPRLRFCLDPRESLSRQLSVWPVAPDSSGTVTLDPMQGRQSQLPGFTWHCQWKDGAFKIHQWKDLQWNQLSPSDKRSWSSLDSLYWRISDELLYSLIYSFLVVNFNQSDGRFSFRIIFNSL